MTAPSGATATRAKKDDGALTMAHDCGAYFTGGQTSSRHRRKILPHRAFPRARLPGRVVNGIELKQSIAGANGWMEPEAALAEALTQFASEDPENEFEHFIVINSNGTVICADRGAAKWDGAEYRIAEELRELVRGAFVATATELDKLRKGMLQRQADTGELRATVLSFANWVVTIKSLPPRGRENRFLIAVNKHATKWVYGASRRAIDKVTQKIGA